jgi:hypothetical protein
LWILFVLLGLVILVGMLLCVPIDLFININTYQAPRFQAGLQWFFGLLHKEIIKIPKKQKNQQKKGRENGNHKTGSGFNVAGTIIKVKGLFPASIRFLFNVIRQIKIIDLSAHFKVGLEDPADSGMLCAVVAPLSSFIRYRFHKDIDIQPLFDGDLIIEGQAYSKIRVVPIRIIAVTLGFIFSIPGIKVIKILILKR